MSVYVYSKKFEGFLLISYAMERGPLWRVPDLFLTKIQSICKVMFTKVQPKHMQLVKIPMEE